ncbi:hypothetical protein [Brucella anthropi]|uniref:hypothetical protein n=1 Tax=Brucella anthropi TaxID=529 RepID=UPI0024480ABB|nr:hypothetical protein [Brucella anthropi]MDG9791951.1 hypothetical protein [Brucella anthropi]MDH0583395.1 hypothetical protein [Brucella anthropi]MDH0818235.1 hypothetical protein [Brucella anthropi]MDH2085387.1 hypothetical protein [Brucella anthropi]
MSDFAKEPAPDATGRPSPMVEALKIVRETNDKGRQAVQTWADSKYSPTTSKCGELVTVAQAHFDEFGEFDDIAWIKGFHPHPECIQLVTRSQAEELLAAEREKSLFFKTAMETAQTFCGLKDKTIASLEADNAALTDEKQSMLNAMHDMSNTYKKLTTRVKELEKECEDWCADLNQERKSHESAHNRAEALKDKLTKAEELLASEIRRERDLAAKQLSEVVDRMSDDYLALKAELDQAVGAIEDRSSEYEALEAKLAAAEKALTEIASFTQTTDLLWWQERARVALGGKPS